MSSLSANQALFILRTLKRTELYSSDITKSPKDFIEALQKEIENPLGKLLLRLVNKYLLNYDSLGNITFENLPTVYDIRKEVAKIGMRIPHRYRDCPESSLKYLENFGYLYKNFSSPTTEFYKLKWLDTANENSLTTNPSLIDNDTYLNPFLRDSLNNSYTDFDFFAKFKFIKDRSNEFDNRNEIIEAICSRYSPAGTFLFSFSDKSITLKHIFKGDCETYPTPPSIQHVSYNGILYFRGNAIDYVGLYQIAFLLHPDYLEKIHKINLSAECRKISTDLYFHFLNQIKIAEANLPKYRFSNRFVEFNRDLE